MRMDRFKQIIEHIKAHPETWDQRVWHCGTVHCLFGHAQIMSGKPPCDRNVRADAREWLDMTYAEARFLSDTGRTLADFEAVLSGAISAVGLDQDGFDRDGYDRDGFDRDGFTQDGFDRDGFDRDGSDRAGYGRDGFNLYGRDRDGFDRDGFGAAGYDRTGYDRHGYDRDGFDRNNKRRPA